MQVGYKRRYAIARRYNRIRNALLQAYGDLELLDMLTEDLDAELKNVIKAMAVNSPRIALINRV